MRITKQSEFKRQSRATIRIAIGLSILLHASLLTIVPPRTSDAYRPDVDPIVVSDWRIKPIPTPPPSRFVSPRLAGDLPTEEVHEESQDALDVSLDDEPTVDPPIAPVAPTSVSGTWDEDAELVRYVEPQYPSMARAAGIEGTVLLRVHVDETGRVVELFVERTDAGDVFTADALRAVREWRFRPARQGGRPVASWLLVPLRFRLR
jgi:protein TonB